MPHRLDIDGLRALAVLPVLLYHAGVPGFSGGYVGVDVFFVISGYLITGLIAAEVGTGTFTLAGFYERRARRILPALFVMLFVSAIVMALLQMPDDYARFGRSLMATLAFVSNHHFLADTGYFEPEAMAMPLLHTWSLAVEEQFYLVFPVVLLLSARGLGRRSWLPLVALLLGLSLAACYLVQRQDESAAFYLGPLRAWELMLGAGLALAGQRLPRWAWLREILGLGGLAMILFAVGRFDDRTNFPAFAALLPCIGTALVLLSGGNATEGPTAVQRLLSLRLPVAIGLVSYSLYLWHWPVLVALENWLAPQAPGWASLALALGLSALLAVLSWRYVEQPFRRRAVVPWRPAAAALCGLGAVLLAAGLAIAMTGGFPGRLPARALAYLEVRDDKLDSVDDCEALDFERRPAACSLGNPAEAVEVVLWGDSHARVLSTAVDAAADTAEVGGIALVSRGCPPLMPTAELDRLDDACVAFNERVLRFVEESEVDVVVLHARWPLYVEGQDFPPDGSRIEIASGADIASAVRGSLEALVTRLEQQGISVVVVGGVPEVGIDVPTTLARMAFFGQEPDIVLLRDAVDARQRRSWDLLDAVASAQGVAIFDPRAALCDNLRCDVQRGGASLYADANHLSPLGVAQLTLTLAPLIVRVERLAND